MLALEHKHTETAYIKMRSAFASKCTQSQEHRLRQTNVKKLK